jgi:copper(I)-binding protein
MKKKYLAVFLLALFSSFSVYAAEKNSAITLLNGWIRETPPGAQNAASFLSLHNNSATTKYITAIQCDDAAARCELHEHLHIENGGMRMQQVTAPLAVPANSTLAFAPGGYHIMLFNIKKPLRAGENVALTFVFNDQSTLSVQLPVKSIRAE